MRTIKIAPDASDCKVVGNEVIGKFNGRTLVYQIPAEIEVYSYQHESLIENFRAAIAMSSKPWQVERLLNDMYQIEGNFYEK